MSFDEILYLTGEESFQQKKKKKHTRLYVQLKYLYKYFMYHFNLAKISAHKFTN